MATQYVEHKFYRKSRERLEIVKALIKPYEFITLRGIHYQLVTNNIIENTPQEYYNLGHLMKWARLTGEIPFEKIIDETREAERQATFDNILEALRNRLLNYRSDWWADQPEYIEVWLEKRTLKRIVYAVSNKYGVYLCTGGGYQSWSEIHEAKQRFEMYKSTSRRILYLGDFDPSGEDMDRDITERLDTLRCPVTVERVAITPGDAREYNLPPQFAKRKDSRTPAFIEKYGARGWELDALPPSILQKKIEAAIKAHCDTDLLDKHRREDNEDIDSITIWQNDERVYWYHLFNKDDKAVLSVLAKDDDDARERMKPHFERLGFDGEWWAEKGRPVWRENDDEGDEP